MKNKPAYIDFNEYQSIRYLNLFRLLLSFFFFSIIFKEFGSYVGFTYNYDAAKLLASGYLAFAILTWVASALFKEKSIKIGLIALIIDLPMTISLVLLFDGLNDGWAILPVITIGSYSILSRKPYSILAMPITATLLLWLMPSLMSIPSIKVESSSILLYALSYFGIALVGIRQSQNYTQSLILTQKQKTRITNLSVINKLIIDQMQSGVIAFDYTYTVILSNKKAKELVNISKYEKLPAALIKKIIATPVSTHKNFIINGEDVILNLMKREKDSGLSLLFLDQQKQINEKSQQSNLVTLGQLSATIAHELRNPMASIYNASQLLQESPDINKEDKHLSEIIIKQVERSNKIIEDILLMSKPHVANQNKFNLYKKLTDFQHGFCKQHKINSEQFTINFSDEALSIKFDNTHFNQLLWNLAENALRHGEDRILSIDVSNQAKNILIDIKNKGAAFEPIVEESLFTPFFTTHTQGTGLGLYICREMCRSNNAKLEYLRLEFQHVFRIHVAK